MPTPAGMRQQRRHPDAERSLVDERGTFLAGDRPCHFGLERGGDRDGQQPVREHEERERGEIGRRVAGSGPGEVSDDDQRDLIGGDEPQRPCGQLEESPHRGVSEVDDGAEAEAGAQHRRHEHDGHRGDAERRAESEREAQTAVAEHVVQGPVRRARIGEREQGRDDDQVGQDRGPGGGEEPSPAVEECIRQADESVEEDLDEEDPRQRRAGAPEQIGVDGVGDVDRVEAEDERCCDDRQSGECRHQEHRHGEHDVGRLLVAVLVERREQRHERRRQDAAEQQLVHDVRRLVGQAVGIGERRLAEDVAEGDHPDQTGQPRQ